MTKIPKLSDKELNILIVEDEMLLAMGMKCTINNFGYSISGIETTGKNAIENVKKNKPDLIFMDIHLKGQMSGIEAAKFIWQYYKIPIIFLTSYSDEKTIKNAMTSEPYAYLLKPCRDEELLANIQTTMHKHNYFYKNRNSLEDKVINKNLIFINECFSFNKAKSILYKNNVAIKLTGNEVKLFEILTDYPNEPVNFNRIYDYIWRNDFNDIAKLRTLIYRLKNKLGENLIENIFEVGYKLKTK